MRLCPSCRRSINPTFTAPAAIFWDMDGTLVDTEPLLEYKGWPWAECPQLVDRQVITKFEGKGLDKDHTITEFLWQRTDAPASDATA